MEKRILYNHLATEVENSYIPQFKIKANEKVPNYFISINFKVRADRTCD